MNLVEMLSSEEYVAWHSDRMGDTGYNDPDRDTRCFEAAKEGADGSFHAEVMNDWQSYLDFNVSVSKREYHEINIEIMDCWDRHDREGSLYDEVG